MQCADVFSLIPSGFQTPLSTIKHNRGEASEDVQIYTLSRHSILQRWREAGMLLMQLESVV